MVKVALLADSPTLTTGFGRSTSHMAAGLARAGHDVHTYGLKARPDDLAGHALPYRVHPAETGGHWTEGLREFFESVSPQVLLMNMDAKNALECVDACAAAGWSGPTVSYVCFDGLPVAEPYLETQRRCTAVWTTSPAGRRYLEANGVETAGCATSGVDRSVFKPHPDRAELLRTAGLEGATVVGAFATNTQRKRLDRIVGGFALARERLRDLDLRLYLHCSPTGASDLRAQAAALGVSDAVTFAGDGDHDEPRGLSALDYVSRLNMCSMIVNAPDSGDTEQVIFEAQACAIPLLHTDDGAIMSEAFGAGALPLAGEVETGPIGQRLNLVAPETIAAGIVRVASDADLRAALVAAGEANAARYGWDVLEQGAVRMALSAVEAEA